MTMIHTHEKKEWTTKLKTIQITKGYRKKVIAYCKCSPNCHILLGYFNLKSLTTAAINKSDVSIIVKRDVIEGETLQQTFYEAKNVYRIKITYNKIDACPNNRML